MKRIAYEDVLHGRCVVAFDGVVLELFTERLGSVDRLVVGLLALQVSEPNRKGHREVRAVAGTKGGGLTLTLDEANWPVVEPLLREVAAATSA